MFERTLRIFIFEIVRSTINLLLTTRLLIYKNLSMNFLTILTLAMYILENIAISLWYATN